MTTVHLHLSLTLFLSHSHEQFSFTFLSFFLFFFPSLFFYLSLPHHLTRRHPHLLNTLLRGIHPRQQLPQGSSSSSSSLRPSINLSFHGVPRPPLCHHLRHWPFTSPIYVTVYILISLLYPPASPSVLQLYPITRGMRCEVMCMCIMFRVCCFLPMSGISCTDVWLHH